MRRRVVVALAVLAATPADRVLAQQNAPEVVIGAIVDGPGERYNELIPLFRNEIESLVREDFGAGFVDSRFLIADWTGEGVRAAADDLLADPDVDMVVGFGVIASHELVSRPNPAKPVFGVAVLDPELQDLPGSGGTTGVSNVNYIAIPFTFDADLRALGEIVPVRRFAALMSARLFEAIPNLGIGFEEHAARLGLSVVVVEAAGASDALDGIPDDVDAVYVAPLYDWETAEIDALISGLISRRLPSFTRMDEVNVEQGFLATRTPVEIFERLARRLALNIQSVLLGQDAGDLRTEFTAPERLIINMATARAIGVYPPWSVITEAELLYERDRPVARTIDLTAAMREAGRVNLDVAAADQGVAAGRQDVSRARSRLLPQLGVSSTATVIDEDRAQASFGQQAQRSLSADGTLSQLLYSESAWADVSVQGSIQEAREYDLEALQLDIELEAGKAYLDVLRAQTLERIRQENVRLTRNNLDNARLRVRIGAGRQAEILRWENQIAVERQQAIDASSIRFQAEIQLNRVLRRPIEEPFGTIPAGPDDPLMRVMDRIYPYVDDLWSFGVFRGFLAEEARREAPELRAIDALVSARERILSSAGRAYWMPTLALQAGISERLSTGGTGSGGISLPFPDSVLAGFPEVDETSWNVSLRASLPLFEGGKRAADRQQADLEVQRLRLERLAVGDKIEQRVRSALHRAGASYANIDLANDAAEAARSNFELVTEAYAEGAATILDLLDAQNAFLVAELGTANSVHDFLEDFLDVQRAMGHFFALAGDEYLSGFFARLDRYMVENIS